MMTAILMLGVKESIAPNFTGKPFWGSDDDRWPYQAYGGTQRPLTEWDKPTVVELPL